MQVPSLGRVLEKSAPGDGGDGEHGLSWLLLLALLLHSLFPLLGTFRLVCAVAIGTGTSVAGMDLEP